MRKKINLTVSFLIVISLMFGSFVFANPEDGYDIRSINELKGEINKIDDKNDTIPVDDTKYLAENTDPETIKNFIKEKQQLAMSELGKIEGDIYYDINEDGELVGEGKFEETIDLGNGCWAKVSFEDFEEESLLEALQNLIIEPTFAVSRSGHSTLWKKYGNRYFTSKVTLYYVIGSAFFQLENHYNLSAKGIKERYGTPYCSDSGMASVSNTGTKITDATAPKVGHDVDLHATYKVKYGYDPVQWTENYKMATQVKYLGIDKKAKELHITQSYAFKDI